MNEVRVRPAAAGDAEQLAQAWLGGGRELVQLAPERFRVPDEAGLIEFFESDLARLPSEDEIELVAEVDGRIVGSVGGHLLPPVESSRYQVICGLGMTRLYVDHLAVDPPFRRRGIGTALMRAIEEWGRAHGAMSVALDTYASSPLSVPFYEALGYKRGSIVFEKRLVD